MKNKGFTLVELLAVILILSLLILIVIPSIMSSVKSSENKTDDLTLKIIYEATSLYVSNHKENFEEVNGSSGFVTLRTLVNEGLLSEPIKMSGKGDDLTDTKCVEITYNNGYTLELRDNNNCN